MKTCVDFRSEMFRPYLPDDSQVNPGRYGAELAFWISRQLAHRGVISSYPGYEDWGWFIEYSTDDGNEYWLCCGNQEQEQDKWRCFLQPKARSFFGRNKAPVEGALLLMSALRDLLVAEQGITAITWE